MKPSQPSEKVKTSVSGLPVSSSVVDPTQPYWFYEYQWDGPKRHHVPVWEPRRTTFFMVFDGGARHLFSTARILLYYSSACKEKVQPNAWDIQHVESMTHTSRGGISDVTPNDSSLPTLTVAFEVIKGGNSSNSPLGRVVLRPATYVQDLRQDSIHILLERKHSLTPHTLSLSVSFTHSTMLCTILAPRCRDYLCTIHRISEIEYVTTRIVRVLPPSSVRPKVTDACLPTELLLKIFGDNELCSNRHDDLLSFAQVCRAWSCSMEILHSRLSFSEGPVSGNSKAPSKHLLDTMALAKALSRKPTLGLGFRHLTTNILRNPEDGEETPEPVLPKTFSLFTSALIAILRGTKNLQHLHIAQLDASQAEALLAAFHDLREMKTFSLGESQGGLTRRIHHKRYGGSDRTTTTLNVYQLSRCMAKWPALKSIKVHHLQPSTLGLRRFTLRAPGCALTQLTIGRSHVSDKDLMHLFGASAKTLERVAFDRVDGLTNAGLLVFLLAISRNVATLTLLDVALPPVRQWGNLVIGRTERALDVVVDKMPRLRQLVISGDVASEFMLDRRSRVYLNGLEMGQTQIPVIELWLEDVPRLCGFEADWKWPGWHTPERSPRR